MEFLIPFSDGVGKRKTKLEVWISFSLIVGKRLTLRNTHAHNMASSFVQTPTPELQKDFKNLIHEIRPKFDSLYLTDNNFFVFCDFQHTDGVAKDGYSS